jgi:hypothetical protein
MRGRFLRPFCIIILGTGGQDDDTREAACPASAALSETPPTHRTNITLTKTTDRWSELPSGSPLARACDHGKIAQADPQPRIGHGPVREIGSKVG